MGKPRSESDEHYLIDLCDDVLGRKARRQHRFDFLLGDPSRGSGRRARLPVDAYYADLNLVVEIMERQHSEVVPVFDKKATLSGVSRGEQRRLYDQRRQDELPKHGIDLIVIKVVDFAITPRKKLRRQPPLDAKIIRERLGHYCATANS